MLFNTSCRVIYLNSMICLSFINKLQYSRNNRLRLRRTTWDVYIYRNDFVNRQRTIITVNEHPPGKRALADGHHKTRLGHLFINLFDARDTFAISGTGHQQHIRMPDTSGQKHAEAFNIKTGRQAVEHFDIAIITAARRQMKDPG